MAAPSETDRDPTGSGGGPDSCSLAQVTVGACVRVLELKAPPDVAIRLRELGFCEQQRIRLLSKHTHVICQVCNVRLGISRDLAGMIVVEPATRRNGEARS
ncbi:MAG: ferrous iron transport protein A [Limisphaerales bacterium]